MTRALPLRLAGLGILGALLALAGCSKDCTPCDGQTGACQVLSPDGGTGCNYVAATCDTLQGLLVCTDGLPPVTATDGGCALPAPVAESCK